MAYDRTAVSHQEWLGYVQPVGVVVSTPALLEAGAAINRNFVPLHREFLSVLAEDSDGNAIPKLTDFQRFATDVLKWRPQDLEGPDESLTISVPGYDEVLHPDYVVKDAGNLLLLVSKTGADFDAAPPPEPRHWHASPQARFERLLRETSVPAGLLVSPDAIRLVYAPKGESSGHITFKISDMVQVAGRPILAALHMLLSTDRLFTLAQDQRLPALLIASRKHQNVVSNKLSGQVMEALFDLLRGFQSAHDQTGVLTEVLRDDPNQVYAGLLTVLLRLVFILYAEDRNLLSSDDTFVNSYSVGGLFERLREDQAHNPDTMDQRYGAWARLVVLFRLIYKGARHGKLNIPGRKGYLFDPDRYPFLEGRPNARSQEIQIPRVPDGVLYRVLTQLLILDGERLSYRNLDVEQIGSVYEAMMGFELHVAKGRSIALKPKKRNGAPITINLVEALAVAGAKRNDWLNKEADQKLTGKAERDLKEASTVEDLMAALDRRIAKNVTPTIVPAGAMIFQPSAERRRSGSHYTPRSLTQPIVEAALAPVLKNLGEHPKPEQILALKVCDPAMGSGAFLVEACRQLGDALVQAWHQHNDTPILPPDEDELLHARRLVAQRCLYGVDKNVMAVDLAKLSLWLTTLARDHEFTFLDHSLKHGDSLVGWTAKQAAAFHWEPKAQETLIQERVRRDIASVAEGRRRILDAQDGTPYAQLSQELGKVEEKLKIARNLGDVLVSAFFGGKNARSRENARQVLLHDVDLAFGDRPDAQAGVRLDNIGAEIRARSKPLVPFHWELEFPEVFALDRNLRPERGFDTIVGNPPFAGKNTIIDGSPAAYIDWLKQLHANSHGNADLVAHFFRRAFNLLQSGGTFGLIATNTIAQGDTRSTGLRWICEHKATIYRSLKRYRWPGEAAVIVSVIHVCKGAMQKPYLLSGKSVENITAYLFHAGGSDDPVVLSSNVESSFIGVYVMGMGFTFDDKDTKGVASPISDMTSLVKLNEKNGERIFPYLSGEDINDSPTQSPRRFVINFEDFPLQRRPSGKGWLAMSLPEQLQERREGVVAHDYPFPVAADWPDVLHVVEKRVRPERLAQNDEYGKKCWWRFLRTRPELYAAKTKLSRVLVTCTTSKFRMFCFVPSDLVIDKQNAVFVKDSWEFFAAMSSRTHELWAAFFGSTLEDRLVYTPSDCFDTFAFPVAFEQNLQLREIGEAYYEFRASLMVRNNEGLTKTYNRFHSPDENFADITELRRLHDAMDRAVLDVYGWHDLQPVPAFFAEFDDEDEEDEGGRPSRPKQKKYRYRWPDEIHDEVLARLLALNAERAALQRPPETIPHSKAKQGKLKSMPSTKEDEPALF